MTTQFPTGLDALNNPAASDSQLTVSHSALHGSINDAIEAMQAKIGINGSLVPTSLDYRAATLETFKADLGTANTSKGGALVAWISAGANAIARTVLRKLYDLPVHLFDFVPFAEHAAILAGTSVYDCGLALSRAIAHAASTSAHNNVVQLPRGLINTSSIFDLNGTSVRFKGTGCGGPGYSGFATTKGTTIKYTGVDTNAVMFTFRHINYGGAGMDGVTLDGGGVAKRCLILDGVLGFSSENLGVVGFTNVGVGLISTSDTTSWNQFKNLYILGETGGAAGSTCLWLSGGDGAGSTGSNACHNTFENVHINHGGLTSGITLGGCDNNTFLMVYIYRASGSAKGVQVAHALLDGGTNWFPIANTFVHLQAGNGGWDEPAGGNATFPTAVIYGYQTDNGQPLPTTGGRRLPYITNSGDWVGARSIGKTSYGADWSGSVSAVNGTTSTVVTFGSARSSNAYAVVLNAPTTVAHAITGKTTAGFTIAWASALPSTYSVDWLILGG